MIPGRYGVFGLNVMLSSFGGCDVGEDGKDDSEISVSK